MIKPQTYTVRPYVVSAGAVTGAINMLILADRFLTLTDYFKKYRQEPTIVTSQTVLDQQLKEEYVAEEHIITEKWVSSPEHETAVLLDFSSTGLTSKQALAGLRKLYPRKEDISGVRLLGMKTKMIIVFANIQLQEHALLYGFQMNSTTVLYPTKALDNEYNHTLFVIEGLPIEDRVTTRQKLESSLTAIFRKTPDPRQGQHRVEGNPWPPTIHDVFFHQSNGGYYDGLVTVILRGSVAFLQKSIKLEAFNGDSFNCTVDKISFYCHHCMRIDRHTSRYCPSVRRES